MSLQIYLPLRTWSMANSRWHWARRMRIARRQREAARTLVSSAIRGRPLGLPLVVVMTRLGPGKLDDDNLAGALKHVRDGIADAVGTDDGDARWTWICRQEKARGYGVCVEINSPQGTTSQQAA